MDGNGAQELSHSYLVVILDPTMKTTVPTNVNARIFGFKVMNNPRSIMTWPQSL